ncbi:hypothetical protein [Mycobacterium shigaense]|uniref:Uncharacterized protein n=1 Tax=Mycobacterium shigaense TaxID=722731 RepID=A0A1Z4EMR0_9MYCO|nr:hypothetical protein [Mycobacterium shigaense]PRI13033.1 hypothetical protein B2J96_23490 [Mycobacterium shigaense]BAX94245.1 hypothetical protein MSG_04124 [Mycobacterium shigaense]
MTPDQPDHPRRKLPKSLAGHNIVFIDEDDDDDGDDFDDEDFDDDPGDFAFCLGREAAHRGESEDQNPYPETDARPGSIEWFDTDYGLWLAGHGIGSGESQG